MKLSPDKPINPRSFPFYYGWFLVPMTAIGILMSIPGQTAGFSAFTESLLKVTGFSRTNLSFLYMIGTITSGFILPTMGKVLDRWGSRKMMITASFLLGLTLFWLSYIDHIVLWCSFLPPYYVYIILVTFGIFSLRFLGQGLLTITANTMIGKWFDKKRGRAIAIIGVANSFVFSATPALMAVLVSRFAWNGAWRLLAIIVGVGMSLTAYLFYRNTPEECGLLVDGERIEDDNPHAEAGSSLSGLSRAEAVHVRVFWVITLVLSTNALVITGLTFHIQAIGLQAGMSVEKAVAIFIPVAFIGIPTSFLSAILTERIHVRWIVSFMAFSQFVAFIAIYFLNTPTGYVFTIIGLGFSSGLMGTIQTAVVPKVFGRLHLGSINGLITSIIVIMSALGPVFLSVVNDIGGSLRTGVIIMSVLPVITLIISHKMQDTFPKK